MKKKLISMVLVLAMVFSFSGCNLFNDASVVKFDENYTHEDPKDVEYDERIALKGTGFESYIEEYVNQMAYPDTMVYDENGQMIGMYDYDENTGIASGWTSLSDGTYTEFKKGNEIDLGKPDESKKIDIPGEVTLYMVVYGNKEEAVSTYVYLYMSDASAKETLKTNFEDLFAMKLTEENENVLKGVQDKDYIAQQFEAMSTEENPVEKKDATSYASILKMNLGVKEYGKVNPFKPYSEHKDPEDLEFDQTKILTGSAEFTVADVNNTDKVKSMTIYVYGNQGKAVGEYLYIECNSKEDADKLLESEKDLFGSYERISDTVFKEVRTGKNLEDLIISYIGYGVLKDDSFDGYVTNLEETYFISTYEEN